jgi:hypothetical protein
MCKKRYPDCLLYLINPASGKRLHCDTPPDITHAKASLDPRK